MRRLAVPLLLAAVALGSAAPAAAAEAACELAVTPREGPPGTEFVFTGSGYTPTRLTLRQAGEEPRVIELDLDDADPFEIPLVATEADAGPWTVTASIPATECQGRAHIRVTLPDTSAAQGASPASAALFLIGILGIAVTFLGGAWLLPRRLRSRLD